MAKIYAGSSDTKNIYIGTSGIKDVSFIPAADPVLEHNSWAEIEAVALKGTSANYWSVGDTKTDLGADGFTRTFRIVDIESDGSIVFEQVNLEGTDGSGATGVKWDADNLNNYYQSDIRNITLPAVLIKYSSALQAVITTTNVKVATSGSDATILTLTDKLFLEAGKELGLSAFSVSAEKSALTTFAYYETYKQRSYKIKYNEANSAGEWWLRSPNSGNTTHACTITASGTEATLGSASAKWFAPCFRIGAAQTGGLGPYVPTPSVNSNLNDNSWSIIRLVCEAGEASNYWSVGDIKTDIGTDGITRTFRIVDMSGLYGKHVVFEQVGLEGTDGTGAAGVVWDADNSNDYAASDMNTTILPSVVSRYSTELQDVLTNTTVQVAENGNSSTIVNVTNKLFLAAEKEIGLSSYSRSEEQSALTTFAYYATHNQDSDRVKYNQANIARDWWLRSPRSGFTRYACIVSSSGGAEYNRADSVSRFAPCFAL